MWYNRVTIKLPYHTNKVVNKITYVYGSTYYKNYIEIPNDNRVLIGYDKKSLGVGTTDGNIVTGLNPTELLNKDNLVLNIKLDDFKYESRKLRRLEDEFLTGAVFRITLTSYAGAEAYELEFTEQQFVDINNIIVGEYIRLSGNNAYLKVVNIKNNGKIEVVGNLNGSLIGSSIFRFKYVIVDKQFRKSYENKEFLINVYSNNENGLLQYDEFGNFITGEKQYIKSCNFFEGFNAGTGLLLYNDIGNKTCIIYNTFNDFTSKDIEGTYLINPNEQINYKVNAFRKQINFTLSNTVIVDELSTNDVHEVQLNGIKLEEDEDYDIVYSENKIVFKGNFLNTFSNNLYLILYSRNQDLMCKVSLIVEGYNENIIEYDLEDYLKDMKYLKFCDGISSGTSFSMKEIERSDLTMSYDKVLGSKNKITIKQLVASDLLRNDSDTITESLLYFVGGYSKKFRIIRVDDLYKRVEYYSDCEIVDGIQKSSQVTGEEYGFTIKYKTREEYEFKATDLLKEDGTNLVLISNN